MLNFRVKHFSAAATELLATMSNLQLLQAKVFSDAQKNLHLLSTSRYLICLKYNSNFVCNLSENCRLQLCAFFTSHSQQKNVFVYVFATNFELLQPGCRTVSNNGSGSGLAPAQNISAVQVWFGFT